MCCIHLFSRFFLTLKIRGGHLSFQRFARFSCLLCSCVQKEILKIVCDCHLLTAMRHCLKIIWWFSYRWVTFWLTLFFWSLFFIPDLILCDLWPCGVLLIFRQQRLLPLQKDKWTCEMCHFRCRRVLYGVALNIWGYGFLPAEDSNFLRVKTATEKKEKVLS